MATKKTISFNVKLVLVGLSVFLAVLSPMTLINLKPDKKTTITEPPFTDIEAGSTKAKFILASGIDYDLETIPEEKEVEIAPGIKAIKKKDGLVHSYLSIR